MVNPRDIDLENYITKNVPLLYKLFILFSDHYIRYQSSNSFVLDLLDELSIALSSIC